MDNVSEEELAYLTKQALDLLDKNEWLASAETLLALNGPFDLPGSPALDPAQDVLSEVSTLVGEQFDK